MYITFIAFAVAGIITSILVKATEKHDFENADTNHFEIKLPKGFLILSIIVFCAELTLSVIALFADISQPILSATFLGCGYLLCAFLIIAYKRYRIFIDGETITYTPVIGKKKTFTFFDITNVVLFRNSYGQTICHVYVQGKKTFSFNNTLKNFNLLFALFENYPIYIDDKRK